MNNNLLVNSTLSCISKCCLRCLFLLERMILFACLVARIFCGCFILSFLFFLSLTYILHEMLIYFVMAIYSSKKEKRKNENEDHDDDNNNNLFSFAFYPSRIVISCNELHAILMMTECKEEEKNSKIILTTPRKVMF